MAIPSNLPITSFIVASGNELGPKSPGIRQRRVSQSLGRRNGAAPTHPTSLGSPRRLGEFAAARGRARCRPLARSPGAVRVEVSGSAGIPKRPVDQAPGANQRSPSAAREVPVSNPRRCLGEPTEAIGSARGTLRRTPAVAHLRRRPRFGYAARAWPWWPRTGATPTWRQGR